MANVAPTLSDVVASDTFGENLINATPQLIDAGVTFRDPDNNFNTGHLTVTGLLAEDRVAIRDEGVGAGLISLSGSNVTYGGTTIGSFTGGVGNGFDVTFNASATAASIDALIQNLTYGNISDTPTADRTLTLDVVDAAGAHVAGFSSFSAVSGASSPVNNLTFGSSDNLIRASFGDLDGDGDLDAFVSSYNGAYGGGPPLAAYRNNGDGTFTSIANPLNSSLKFGAVAFLDIDGDGDLDAVVGSGQTISLRTFERQPGNSFVELTGGSNPFANADPGFLYGDNAAPAAVDVDADGRADLVWTSGTGEVHYFHHNADNSFSNLTGASNPFDAIHLASGFTFKTVTFADVDGDGDPDMVASSGTTIRYFRNIAGTFTEQTGAFDSAGNGNPFNSASGVGPLTPVFADFDGDGDSELVVGQGSSVPYLFFQNSGTFGRNIAIHVTAESDNDPPSVNHNAGLTLDEGATGTLTATELDFDDPEQADPAITYTVTSATANGELRLNGSALAVNDTFTQDDVNNGLITYAHDGGETTSDSFGFTVSDGAGGSVTGQTFALAVTAVNDTPVNTVPADGAMSGLEDQTIAITGMQVSDADAGSLPTVTINLFTDQGYLHVDESVPGGGAVLGNDGGNGSPVLVYGTLAQVNATLAALSGVVLHVDPDFNGPVTIGLTSNDGGATGIDPGLTGDSTFEFDYDEFVVDVVAVNDAPVLDLDDFEPGSDAAAAYAIGDAPVTLAPNAVFSDVDTTSFDGATLTVSLTANGTTDDQLQITSIGTGLGEIAVSGNTVSYEGVDIGTFTGGTNGTSLVVTFNADACHCGIQMVMENVTFAVTGAAPGTAQRTLSFMLVDGDGTANGGADTATADVTVDITAPPHVDVTAATATEQVPLDLKGTIHVSDLDTTGDVTVILSVDYGELAINAGTSGVDVTQDFPDEITLVGTVDEIEALLNTDGTSAVSYTYDDDYPPPEDTLAVTIDDGATTNSDSAQITITAVNDAPEVDLDFFEPGNDAAATWTEGDGPQLLAPYAYFDDDNDSHDGATLTITVNGATTGDQLTIDSVGTDLGELSISGTDVLYEGEIVGTWSGGVDGAPLVVTFNADACYCSIELAMASVLYENGDNLTAASARTVDFTFVDGDGTANGGDDTTTSSVDLTVLPFAEVIAGTDAAGNEDAPIALTGVVIDGVADDPASGTITVRLSVDHGSLDLRTDVAGGLAAGDIVGNGSDFVLLTGTQDAVNATLAASNGLTYQGAADFFGSDELSIQAVGDVSGGALEFSEIGGLPVPFPIARLDMIDIDGDGTSDMVFGVQDALIVYGSAVAVLSLDDPGIPTGFAFADYDGDGDADIAFTTAGPAGYVAFASSDTGDLVKLGDLADTFDLVTGDFNGDGLADIAATDGTNGRVALFLQDTPGSFAPVAYTTPGTGAVGFLAAGDFNGDSHLDLLASSAVDVTTAPPGSIDLLLGNGDGTFQAPVELLSGAASPGEVVVADFDGDGELDFAYASSNDGGPGTNGVVVALGHGDGTFATPVGYDTTTDGEPVQLVAADFNGDSVLDLAVANANDPGTFSILVGNGDGSFEAPVDFDTVYPAFAIAFGDPDGDGDLDLITGSLDGAIEFFNNDLDGTARSADATKSIIVAAVNDAPTSADLAGDAVTWIEGNAPVLLDAGTAASFGDVDSADFDGGSLTLAITGGDPAQDVLAIVDQGTGSGQIGIAGADVTYEGVTIGTVSGGSGGAALQVSLNVDAAVLAVEALARAITYGNIGGGDPSPGTRTIGWTLVDGGGTADGGNDTLDFTSLVTVISGQPVIDLNGGAPGTSATAAYTEGDAAFPIAPSATVSDPDATGYAGGVLAVTLTANAHADDSLTLLDQGSGLGAVSVSETAVFYDFGVIGPEYVGDVIGGTAGQPLVITFAADATPEAVEAVMRAVGFMNFGTTPGALTRTVAFTLSDSDGDTSIPATATIGVTPVLSDPVVHNDVLFTGDNTTLTGNVFADNGNGNDYDSEGGSLQITKVNGSAVAVGTTITLASGALLRVNPDGSFSYNPNGAFSSLVPVQSGAANFEGGDSFSYTVTGGITATATVHVFGAVSAGDVYDGSTGSDLISGTGVTDTFNLSQGGDDAVDGGGGNDAFYFGAAFTAADTVNGGAGNNDQVGLEGNYTGANALVLGAGTISGVEVIALLPGFDYDLTTVDANVPNGGTLKIFAGGLGVGDDFTFDGSAETDGNFMVFGGLGTDVIKTGAGVDGIYFGPGKFDPTVDRVDGGSGINDQLALDGDYTLTLDGIAIKNIDVIALLKGIPGDLADYNLTLANSLTLAGQTTTIWGSQVDTVLTVNGAAESDGALRIFGGTLGDTLTGGAGDDWFWGGLGGDTMTGGLGADTFMFESVAQSTIGGHDQIVGFDDTVDKIDLPGAPGVAVTSFATGVLGTLNAATLESDIGGGSGGLGAHQALVFTANGGDLNGHTFLVVDANGTAGYQAAGDFLIEFVAPVSPLDQLGMFA